MCSSDLPRPPAHRRRQVQPHEALPGTVDEPSAEPPVDAAVEDESLRARRGRDRVPRRARAESPSHPDLDRVLREVDRRRATREPEEREGTAGPREADREPHLPEVRHDGLGDVEVRVDVLDVLEVLERLDEVQHLFRLDRKSTRLNSSH